MPGHVLDTKRGVHLNRSHHTKGGPVGYRNYPPPGSVVTCTTCPKPLAAKELRAGVRRCLDCRIAQPGRPKGPTQPIVDSWWIGADRTTLNVEASKRFTKDLSSASARR